MLPPGSTGGYASSAREERNTPGHARSANRSWYDDGLAEKLTEYRKALAERPTPTAGRHVALMIHTYPDDEEDRAREIVREPLSDHMRSSLHLLLNARLDGRRKVDVSKLSAEDVDFMVSRAFDRYFDFGLPGTVDKAADAVERFRSIGVDELACLIDFGLLATSGAGFS
ncbi:hypothetical protein JCM33774_31160 [Actinophytocola sp. KF-1]